MQATRQATIVRSAVILSVLALALVLTPAIAGAAAPGGPQAADETRLLELVNQERRAHGLAPVHLDLQLTRIARGHSSAMAADVSAGGRCGDGSTLRHRSPLSGGVSAPWTMLRENVACNRPVDVERIHQSLMNSPGHRSNILASDVRFIGIGAWHDDNHGLWVTQIFMDARMDIVDTAPVDEGIRAARAQFPGDARPEFVVLSRSDVFADSLGGASLAGTDGAILFTDPPSSHEADPVLRPETRAEIDRLLGGAGTVYVLGGTAAVSARVEQDLHRAGYKVRRLAGHDRFATATSIAEEIVRLRGAPDYIAVANGRNWPDAVTGGAAGARAGIPLVLTEGDSLPGPSWKFLTEHPEAERVVLGGRAAVGDGVRQSLGARRLAGVGREQTALAIADDLFGQPGSEVVVVDGWDSESWGRALAWASYSAARGAPQIMVGPTVPAEVATWLAAHRGSTVRFAAGVSPTARDQVSALLG